VPVTTVPTIVRYGIPAAARVRFETGAGTEIPVTTVDEYVSEEKTENAGPLSVAASSLAHQTKVKLHG
jgi:hypothetical protein